MADTTKLLLQALLTNADASLGGPAAGKKWVISNLHIANTSASTVTVRLNHATAGASTVTNRFVPDIGLGGFSMMNEAPFVFENGHTLRGLANVTGVVNVSLYGIESA
ncbi:MAG TPA: hypothetical protein VF077_13295 [Nitrospiraceae bacterium]